MNVRWAFYEGNHISFHGVTPYCGLNLKKADRRVGTAVFTHQNNPEQNCDILGEYFMKHL